MKVRIEKIQTQIVMGKKRQTLTMSNDLIVFSEKFGEWKVTDGKLLNRTFKGKINAVDFAKDWTNEEVKHT